MFQNRSPDWVPNVLMIDSVPTFVRVLAIVRDVWVRAGIHRACHVWVCVRACGSCVVWECECSVVVVSVRVHNRACWWVRVCVSNVPERNP